VLRVGYAEVIFIQPDGKLDTMWRDAWQRLASSYPTSRWDVAINLMVTAAERCSLSHRQKHKLAAWEPVVHFVHRIARIWTRLLAIWAALQQTVYHHQSFSSVDKIKTALLSKAWQKRSHSAVIANTSFLSPFYLRLMLFARWRHYFPRLIQINYGRMFSMKRTWFMPNLVKICSIFLKL